MKKFLLVALMLLSGLSVSQAATRAPQDIKGITLPTVDFVGASVCVSTAATAILCNSGPTIVYGIAVSSDAATNFMVMRDSNTANTSSTVSLIAYNQTQAGASIIPGTVMLKFPVAAKFSNGLSVNLATAVGNPGTSGQQSQWAVFYRKLTAND